MAEKERPLYTLYKGLKANNYDVPDNYDSFEKTLTEAGNGGANSRHTLYNSLKEQNFDVPDTYEQFYSNLFTPVNKTTSRALGGSVPMSDADKARFSRKAAAISAQAGQAVQRFKNTQRASSIKKRQQKEQNDFGRVDLGTKKTSYGTENAVRDDFGIDQATGKIGTYITSSGEEIGNEYEAGQQQQAENKYNAAYNDAVESGGIPSAFDVVDKNGNYDLFENVGQNGTHVTEEGARRQLDAKIADATARLADINARIKDIDARDGNPLFSYSASIGAGSGASTERKQLGLARTQVENELRSLNAIQKQPDRNWLQNMGQGFSDTALTANAWDFGLNDFAVMGQMERIKAKVDNNIPLTNEEKRLAQSKIGSDAAAALADEEMGRAYRWSGIAGQSVPFMFDFLVTGGFGGLTHAAGRAAVKFAAKKGMGTLGKNVLKYTGVTAANIVGSYAMAGTEQVFKTGADIMNRHLGTLYQDENGNYAFGTFDENGNLVKDGGEGFGTALYKGLTAAMLENYTEKVFRHTHFKRAASKALSAHFPKFASFLATKGAPKWMKRLGIDGLGEEIMEEEINIPLNALLVGDNKLSDLGDLKQQGDIIFGIGLSVGGMYALKLIPRGAAKIYNNAQYYRFKNKMDNVDSRLQQMMGDRWNEWKDKIDGTPNEEMGVVIREVLQQKQSGSLNEQEINSIGDYILNLAKVRGYNLAKTTEMDAKAATGEETTPEDEHQQEQEQAYSEGQDAEGEEKHEIQQQLAEQESYLAQLLGVSEEQLTNMDLESLQGQDDNLDIAIYNYQNAYARYQGVMDKAQSAVDAAEENARAEVQRRMDTSRGTVRNATIKSASNDLNGGEDYGVYIVSGNVATNEDGTINVADSDDMILYFDPLTGKIEHADASRFSSLGEEVDAELTIQQTAELARQDAIAGVARDIDGKVGEGSRFVVIDNQGQQHVYEVLADNGDGTASITIDGNVIENVFPSFDELQKMKDDTDRMRVSNYVTERQAEREQQQQANDQEKQKVKPIDWSQLIDPNGTITTATIEGEDKLAFVVGRTPSGKLRVAYLNDDNTVEKRKGLVSPDKVMLGEPIALDEYRQMMGDTNTEQSNNGEDIVDDASTKEVEDSGETVENGSGIESKVVSDKDFDIDSIDFDNNYVVIHQTLSDNADSILRDGLHTIAGLNGTSLFANRETIEQIIQEQREGRGHKGSTGLVIMQFPKSMFEEGKRVSLDDISIALEEKYGPDALTTVPPEYISNFVLTHESNAKSSENVPNEEKEAPKFSDGTPIPLDKDGEADFSQMTPEQAVEWYDTNLGDDAQGVIDANVASTKKALDKAQKVSVKPAKPSEMVKARQEKQASIDAAQIAYDNAVAVSNAYNEMLLGRALETPEGRKSLLDKAKAKFDRLKNKDEWKNNQQALWNETIGNVLHRLYDGTSVDVFDPESRTVEEYVSSNLAPFSLNYEGSKTAKGVKQETGLERKDFAKSKVLAAEGKGQTVDAFVHKLWQNRPPQLESATDQDIRNAVIGLITGNMNAYDMRHVIENNRIAEAERMLEDEKNAADNAAHQEEQKENVGVDTSAEEITASEEGKPSAEETATSEGQQPGEQPDNTPSDNMPFGEQLSENDLPFSPNDGNQVVGSEEREEMVDKNKATVEQVSEAFIPKKLQRAIARIAKMMSKVDGKPLKIQYLYSADADGWFDRDTNTLYLALDSSKALQMVFGHEMTHAIKSMNTSAYDELKGLVKEFLGADFDKAVDATEKFYNAHGVNYDNKEDYEEEVIADGIGTIIDDLNLTKGIVLRMSHPLLAVFHDVLMKIRLAFRLSDDGTYERLTHAVKVIEKAYVDTANGTFNDNQGESGEHVAFSLREKPEPKKKGVGYKVFFLKDGKLYPPMVANPNGAATPVGVWLDADAASIAGESKTGRPQVKQGGKGTQGGSGKLAYRPGWHLGVIPYALQFNRKDAEGNKTLFPKDFVFAEVEYAADVDYQKEANEAGINPSGKYQHSLAGLKHLPTDGYYMYRTNPNPETDPWVITGAMKVNRILTRAEQADLVKKAGREPQIIQEGDNVTDDVVAAINHEIANAPKFSLKVYHGSGADFDEFDFGHMGEGAGSQAFGWGGYVTSSKKIGKSYAQSGMQTRTVMVKNNGKWFEFSEDDPMFKVVDEAMYLIKSEGLRGARNFANRWKEDADTEEVRQQWAKVADLLSNHTKADFKSRYPSHLYEVEIPDDNGKNYLDWYGEISKEAQKKIGDGLFENGFKKYSDRTFGKDGDVVNLFTDQNETYGGFYGQLAKALGGKEQASDFLSSLGYVGIKYEAGTIMGGAENGDTNYVIFKPEDMTIASHTKFSLRYAKPVRFEVGKSLSEEEKKEVFSTLKDSYKENNVPFHLEENANGKERRVYEPTANDYMVSDITGRSLRYYITLPDGRIAHPTEVYPNVSNKEVETSLKKRDVIGGEAKKLIEGNIKKLESSVTDISKVVSILSQLQALQHETTDVGYGLENPQSYNYKTGIFTSNTNQAVDYVVRRMRRKEEISNDVVDAVKKAVNDSYGMVDNLIDGLLNSVNPSGVGVFGNIYNQFRGKAKEAIGFLKNLGGGEATAALHHHTIGDISLVWGDKKTGLAKILRKHPEVVDNLQSIIDGMEVVSETDNRIKLESPTHFAVVSKEFKGEPRDKWLLTAFEKKESLANGKSMDTATTSLGGDTALSQTKESAAKIGNSSETSKKNGEKFSLRDEKAKIVSDAKKNGTYLKAPNGKDSKLSEEQWTTVRTDNFKKWFGDWEKSPESASKVVDENGEPMVVYHGRSTDFNTFERKEGVRFIMGLEDKVNSEGFFFTPDYEFAAEYASNASRHRGGKANIVPCFLDIRKPMDLSAENYDETYEDVTGWEYQVGMDSQSTLWDIMDEEGMADKIKAKGYDGAIFVEEVDDNYEPTQISYCALDPNQIKSADNNNGDFSSDNNDIRYSLRDEEYLKAVEDGDMEKAQKMVNEAAEEAGYTSGSDYQGTSAFNGSAPWGNGYFLTKEERKEAWDNGEFEGESTLGDYINDGIDGGNLEELTNSASYRAADNMRKKAILNVRNAIQNKAKTIKMYRSVPSSVKEGSFRNGDWITPSKDYAKDNANIHGWGEDYRIIEQEVPVDEVWFDGNDIAEWGYGREEDYANDTDFAYKNTQNNKKLLDAVTYDDNGNVIPLSKRFNEADSDIRFSLAGIRGAEEADFMDANRRRAKSLEVAKKMEEEGKDAGATKMATGWEKGADGKWRYEIADANIMEYDIPDNIFNDGDIVWNRWGWSNPIGTLYDILDAPELFKFYPELKDIKVSLLNSKKYNGGYVGNYKRLLINKDLCKMKNGKLVFGEGVRRTIVHEVQHAIQDIEGFANGGNADMFVDNDTRFAEFDKMVKEQFGKADAETLAGIIYNKTPEYVDFKKKLIDIGWNDFFKALRDTRKYTTDNEFMNWYHKFVEQAKLGSAWEQYHRLGGEVEARNVQNRLEMSAEERRKSLASETEDVPRSEQDIRFSLKDHDKTMVGVHNISQDKLLKAIKQGGLANPSVAVIDASKQQHEGYGEISLVMPSSKIAKRTGRNAGTWQGDAWTPTYPQVERQMDSKGSDKASNDVMSVPREMQSAVRRDIDRWLDNDSGNSGMAYLFLHERDEAPQMKKTASKYDEKVYNELRFITAGDFNIFGIGEKDTKKVLDMYIDARYGGDRKAYEQSIKEWLDRNKTYLDKGKTEGLRYAIAKKNLEMYDEYGFNYDSVQRFVSDVQVDGRKGGKADVKGTLKSAEDYIKEHSLENDFDKWIGDKERQYGIKEVIFDGFTPSGKRRYVANTLQNVSKIMKKQGRNGSSGLGFSFNNFAAKLMSSYGKLDEIRSKKGLLTSNHEDLDKFREKWGDVFFELGKKCQPDATNPFDDYGMERLSEAALQRDPQAYLKKEYNVDFSDNDLKRLNEMVKAIKEEYPAMYFETKFERPVMFDEFSAAVVPASVRKEVKEALNDAGVPIFEYDINKDGDRKRAFDEAVNSDNNIMFSLRHDDYEKSLADWKKRNGLPKDAKRPEMPQQLPNESKFDFMKRVNKYLGEKALWNTAPTYEGHLLFSGDAVGYLNSELQRGSVLARIAVQDSMLPIRIAQDGIMRQLGLDKIGVGEDAYTAENRSHGKAKNEFEEYNQVYLQPLRKAYHAMKKALGDSYDNVKVYMMSKHGLERNAFIAFRDALKKNFTTKQKGKKDVFDADGMQKAYNGYKSDVGRILNDANYAAGTIDYATYRQNDDAIRTKYAPSYSEFRYDDDGNVRDYAGLSALYSEASDFEVAAAENVKSVEDAHGVEAMNLWDATNAATKKILKDSYQAGMMGKSVYDYVRDMYSNYIPLRGWDGTSADQVWDYIGGGRGAFSQTMKKAGGRKSIADDPIAYIENMAESGILLNNKNYVKQHLLLLAENHPTDLLTVSKAWYVKSKDAFGNDIWTIASPNIPADMTDPGKIRQAIEQFDKDMRDLEEQGEATRKRGHLDIEYPQTNSEAREHEVRVLRDGEEYVIYVNGDPQLAQAMNNARAQRVRERQSGILDRGLAWLGRKMAAAYTSLSPLFIPANFTRDLTMTLASTAIREDARYNYLLRKNFLTNWNSLPLVMKYQSGRLRQKVEDGTATKKEQMFYDFMMNGGETGFVSTMEVEDFKRKIQEELRDMDRMVANPKRIGHAIMDTIELLNRAIEDSNRFLVYMTSIEYGRPIEEAINNAKDVTLNFNRKGTGEYGWQMVRNLYLFINPAIQSLQTLGALAKHHPYKFTAVTSLWLASGVLVPAVNNLLLSMFGGDDDKDKYWSFTKWDRRNNFIMWIPFTKNFVKIPLAQEFRGFYAVGDMIASMLMGGEKANESWGDYAQDFLGQVVDMLPLDPTGYDGNVVISLMPNAIRPFFELAFNVDFTGKPLFKDSEFNKYDPNFTKAYAGTPDWLVRTSRFVNSLGNPYPDVQQNAIDRFGNPRYNLNNPAVIDHVLSSYLGGAYTFGSQSVGVLTKALNSDSEVKMADIPLLSRFAANPDDKPVSKKQGDVFWDMKEQQDRTKNTLSKLKKEAKVSGDYSTLEYFFKSDQYAKFKENEPKIKQYEEDKKKENAEKDGEEYNPHKSTGGDIYKKHATSNDDFEDMKMDLLWKKVSGFKTAYDGMVALGNSQSESYYNQHSAAIDAADEVSTLRSSMNDLKKEMLTDDGKDGYNAEDMKEIRELRKQAISILENAAKTIQKGN